MDADLQNDPDDIPMLLARLEEGFDIVSGWRKNRQDKALTRRLPSKIANWLIGRVSGVRLHDYGCTLKAYRREVLEPVQLYGEMHRFIPVYAKWSGARITEQVVRHHAAQGREVEVRAGAHAEGAARPDDGEVPGRLLDQAALPVRTLGHRCSSRAASCRASSR